LISGVIWAMATWMKWVPVVFLVVLRPRARLWGLVFLALSVVLSLATLPGTVARMEALFGFGRRPILLDYLGLLWGLVPGLWRGPDPFAWLKPSGYRSRSSAWRTERRSRTRRVRGWLGMPYGSPADRQATAGDPISAGTLAATNDGVDTEQ